MKPNFSLNVHDLIKMIQSEQNAKYSKYKEETSSPLSLLCEKSDVLGPLTQIEKMGFTKWKLTGSVFYSRFRPGDRVELRTKIFNQDASTKLSDYWIIENLRYPAPGKIEVIITGNNPLGEDDLKEVFLFNASTYGFQQQLIKKIRAMPDSDRPVVLGTGIFTLSIDNPDFKNLYEGLNDTQQNAIHSLIGNNLSGTIQGPPGTGKTQLLQAVIVLALKSNMKVGVASFTNAAVDNLLGRVSKNSCIDDWVRIGDAGRVRRELYAKDPDDIVSIAPTFNNEINECVLMGATLHKLAYNQSAPVFDLLVIDEAGQVPVFFWPFIQRFCKRLILVGDQHQLPPVLESENRHLPIDNLFSLFINKDTPMLEMQYRMNREIQAWSSEKFYHGKLRPHISVVNRDYFSHHPAFMNEGHVVAKPFQAESTGSYSQAEANFISDRVEKLIRGKDSLETVGVICAYRAQAGIINASLQSRFGVDVASKILVDTVERFQGQEREAIFFSCGVSGSSQQQRKFLSDQRRLNVAVTRARSRFYCLFDEMLYEKSNEKVSEDLHEFLSWVKSGKTIVKKAA